MWGNTTKCCLKRGRGEEGEEHFSLQRNVQRAIAQLGALC